MTPGNFLLKGKQSFSNPPSQGGCWSQLLGSHKPKSAAYWPIVDLSADNESMQGYKLPSVALRALECQYSSLALIWIPIALRKLEWIRRQTWVEVKLAICPKPRHGHAMAIIGQQIFMCGGECVTGTSSRAYGYENLAFKPCMKEAFNSKQDHTEKEQLSKNCSCGKHKSLCRLCIPCLWELSKLAWRWLVFLAGSVNDFWILRGTIHPNEKEQQCWTQLDVAGEPFSPRKAHAVAGQGSCYSQNVWLVDFRPSRSKSICTLASIVATGWDHQALDRSSMSYKYLHPSDTEKKTPSSLALPS